MSLEPSRRFPLMAITLDGAPRDHLEQTRRLCAAGVRWVQLRMKQAAPEAWLKTATEAAAICCRHGAVFIVNDSVEIALAAGADGVHLGRLDLDWTEARRRLGPGRLLGGTVNHPADADRAVASGCLDYAGVGPLRFTPTKQNLAPVLGLAGVGGLLAQLGSLPAWVIGGVQPADLPGLRAAGAAGVAISSALARTDDVAAGVRAFHEAWEKPAALFS